MRNWRTPPSLVPERPSGKVLVLSEWLGHLLADGVHRMSEAMGSCRIIDIWLPRYARIRTRSIAAGPRLNRTLPATICRQAGGPGAAGIGCHGLARTRLADDAQRLSWCYRSSRHQLL